MWWQFWKQRDNPGPHVHEYSLDIGSFDHAEIDEQDPIRHTAFHILGCPCGSATVFPEYNYGLTTLRFRVALAEALKTQGWRLEAP